MGKKENRRANYGVISAFLHLGGVLFLAGLLNFCSSEGGETRTSEARGPQDAKKETSDTPLSVTDSLELRAWQTKLANAKPDSLLIVCDQFDQWLEGHKLVLGHQRWGDQLMAVALNLDEQRQSQKAVELSRKLIAQCKQAGCVNALHLADAFSAIGEWLFYQNAKTEGARDTLGMTLDILFSHPIPDSARLAVNFRKYADICRSAGDLLEANFFIEASRELSQFVSTAEQAAISASKAALLLEEMKYPQSININKSAKVNLKSKDVPAAECNIAIAYQRLKDHNEAINWFQSAITGYQSLKPPDTNKLAAIYGNMGMSYCVKGNNPSNFSSGMDNYHKAIDLFTQSSIKDRQNYSNMLQGFAYNGYQLKNDYPPAIELYHKSLIQLSIDSISSDPYSVPNPEKVVSEIEFFNSMWYKGEAIGQMADELRTTDQEKYLQLKKTALALYESGLKRFEESLLAQTGEFMRDQTGVNLRNAYIGAIILCYELEKASGDHGYWVTAFQLAERSRAHLIQRRIIHNKRLARLSLNNQPEARKNDKEIRAINAEMKQAIRSGGGIQFGESLRRRWQLQQQLRQLPVSGNAEQNPLKDSSILKSLNPDELVERSKTQNEAIIEYFSAGSNSFAFVIADGSLHMKALPSMKSIDSLVLEYLKWIGKEPDKRQSIDPRMVELGHQLYDSLIHPLLGGVSSLPANLMIIPDGKLAELPFDALICSREPGNQNAKIDYLTRHCAISYQQSAAVWQTQQGQDNARVASSMLGADYQPKEGGVMTSDKSFWGTLRYSKEEVDFAYNKVGGKRLKEDENNCSQFKRELKSDQYSIVYLALHGKANPLNSDSSRLIFPEADENGEHELWLFEIYDLDLSATRIAVLSACETALGKEMNGEGVLSFSYAFTASGCKTVLSTLWVVDDAASAELMQSFTRKMVDEGQPLNKALQLAKIESIESGNNSHPYYWAAYVAVGDMRPVEITSHFWLWISVGSAATLIIFFLIFRKLRKR